ncbi:CocE/NonD family hydrolase [Nocardioides stalactiti]|uniref:CocE/NonD family hydrolase n=1 Tax=Nocardioides stalactiti TaxID=2755356 RepID=UPI0015FFD3FD|nr:CocE/NonD family hydrolase [Nocardioides stalactiti]
MNHALSRRARRAVAGAVVAGAVVAAGLVLPTTAVAAAQPRVAAPAVTPRTAAAVVDSAWEERPEQYPGMVKTSDLPITMDDGVVLRGDLFQPADDAGEAVDRKFPVIVMITAYNKTAMSSGGGGLAGVPPSYLVQRGYNYLIVDARGTGSSAGSWAAFSARENKDAGKIVGWAHRQAWSNGKVGMAGPSYMGISQLMAAGHHPPGLKAIFPQVPGADVYRDVVASGGQLDVGFMPLWLGLVNGTALIPPAYTASDPQSAIGTLLDHLIGGGSFTITLALQALLGQDPIFDGPFYRERSALTYLDDEVTVPTFIIGGQFDLFQRGTPLLFEKLQRNGAPVKMIVGPWDHLQGSSGALVGDAGYGSIRELQLRWFDHWIKGRPGHLGEIAPVSYYEQGSGRWVRKQKWVADDLTARSYVLSGTAAQGGRAGVLKRTAPAAGESTLLPLPVSGLCTRSANQWTAGILMMVWAENPCFTDNNLNDYTGLTFETAPVDKAVRFQGPINAHLFVSSLGGDGMLSVVVEDVAPDGTVHRITGGWQVIAQRKLIRARSRYLDGQLIQPWHPFTQESKDRLAMGEIAPVDVEIFPTGAVIRPGHRLRLTIQGYDVPHLLAPIPDLPTQALPLTLYTGPEHRSVVTLPVRP